MHGSGAVTRREGALELARGLVVASREQPITDPVGCDIAPTGKEPRVSHRASR
jgi:hypothetical protein